MASDLSISENNEVQKRPRRLSSRIMILIRRIHLYTGLFLLPWVFLYGITGAMFNHQNLFPEVKTEKVPESVIEKTSLSEFPSPGEIANSVVKALQIAATDHEIRLAENHGAEFSNMLLFEVNQNDEKRVIQINPISKSANVITHPPQSEDLEAVLQGIHNLKLEADPHTTALEAAGTIISEFGIDSSQSPQPLGWTKLNFLAEVDGEPVRVNYVLKDGHVEVTKHTGEDGMSLRRFFLRLHTSHGQPPHWNGRMYWTLIIDAMAIAMVSWGVTGIFMWWQIKRTRIIGAMVVLLSLLTAGIFYLSMMNFYAFTKL